jgi:gas vesicle protein
MADSYDRYENETSSGGFMMGLLTGTVLGAGLGMLLAPKAGAELRGAIGEQARNWGNNASEQYRHARETANTWAEKGRDMVNQAREAATQAADQARNYAGYGSSGPTSGSTGYGNTGSTGYGNTGSTGYGNPTGGDFNRS